MTDTAPILVVFGIDPEGKPRASRFAEKDAELVTKAATLLGFRTARITDEAGRAIAEALPTGNVFARGNGFVRLVRQSAFDKLSAAVEARGRHPTSSSARSARHRLRRSTSDFEAAALSHDQGRQHVRATGADDLPRTVQALL